MAESDDTTTPNAASPTKEKEVPPVEITKEPAEEGKPKEKKVIQKITLNEEDVAKIAKRKERFGLPEKELVEVKKSKRAERFGSTGGGTAIPSTPEIEEKKKARAARFGNTPPEVEEKKKARAARFGAAAN